MFQTLHATSATLRDFLQTSIDADPFFGAAANPWTNRAMRIRLQTPEEVTRNNGQGGLSLWLYRVVRDERRLNDPARRISSNQLQAPPLPMRLHYLATPITNRQNEGDPDTEQYVLGKVLQPFHSRPVQPRGVDLGEMSPDRLVQAIRSAARPERKPYAH